MKQNHLITITSPFFHFHSPLIIQCAKNRGLRKTKSMRLKWNKENHTKSRE